MKGILLFAITLLPLTSCTITIKRAGKEVEKIKTTAYTHTESDHKKYKRQTAIGTTLQKNKSAAADWSIFPVGTILEVADTRYQIDDYGSALVKADGELPVVDIYQPSKKAMNTWGVKYFEHVKVVQWGDFQESADILKDRLKYAHCRVMYDRIQDKL